MVKNPPANARDTGDVGFIPGWGRYSEVRNGKGGGVGRFPGGSEVKVSASNVGDSSSIPGSGRSPGEGNGNPFQYSCLENPIDGEAW